MFQILYLFALLTKVLGYATNADSNATIPYIYPLFGQCDETWADDIMDTKTICDVGCLMSSTSMALAGAKIPIPVNQTDASITFDSTPRTLNQWLRHNDGYDGSNDLMETAVPNIDPTRIAWPDDGMHKEKDISFETIVEYLEKGRIVIGNVNEGGHFVLITGYYSDKDTFAVNDPGYHKDTYSYRDDVVGFRIFDMVRE